MNKPFKPILSFVHRQKRLSESQQRILKRFKNHSLDAKPIQLRELFHREAFTVLEIGFGVGDTLYQQASQNPDINYLGIEVYRPGIAMLLKRIEKANLQNIKVVYGEATEILRHLFPSCLDLVQIFFPDPWPKTRHHKRRLIKLEFINLLHKKMKPNGKLHLATDWENYAQHMLTLLENTPHWKNSVGKNQFMPRPSTRPFTPFEKRGYQLGHSIWDIAFNALKAPINSVD